MNLLTKENLSENMKVKLQAFNDEKVTISGDTVHKQVLSFSDGINGRPSSAQLYRWAIGWTVDRAGGTSSEWPENWLDFSVNDLTDFIIEKQAA